MTSPFYTPLLVALAASFVPSQNLVMPTIGALAATYAPTLQAEGSVQNLVMPTIAALASPFAPVVSQASPQVLAPPAIAATAATFAPEVVDTGDDVTLQMPTIAALAATYAPTVVDADSHRYWRVLFEVNNSGSAMEMREIEFAASRGGSNLATGGTAAASTGTAGNAFDGNTASGGWIASSSAVPQWLSYDFGTPVAIREVRMWPTGSPARVPRTFKVEYSDDNSAWTTAFICEVRGDFPSGQTAWLFGACTYRILVTANNGNSTLRINEMEFRASVSGADESGGTNGRASSSNSAVATAEQAFNDDGTTSSWTCTMASGVALRYDFVDDFTLAEYTVRAGSVSTLSAPKDWTIERSVDGGQTWETVDTRTNETGWTSGEIRTYAI